MGTKDLALLLLLICCEVWICSSAITKTVTPPKTPLAVALAPPNQKDDGGKSGKIPTALSKLLDGKKDGEKEPIEMPKTDKEGRQYWPYGGGCGYGPRMQMRQMEEMEQEQMREMEMEMEMEQKQQQRYGYYGHGGYGHGHGHGYYHRPYWHHHHRPYHHNHHHHGHWHNYG